ncbi:gamma-glutamyltransferase [Aestuariivirga sp.]|uniref:gamma-glutamyltransferase n=1 Tax=Aestuariivirga sp. TaxID=2650926 RepID=UPI00391B72D6
MAREPRCSLVLPIVHGRREGAGRLRGLALALLALAWWHADIRPVNPAEAASRPPVTYQNAMVVTSQRLASEIGAEILRGGGNAVDAAVAVGYALAVVNPCCGNIGGGGFATVHLADGRDIFLNFRERAPLASSETMYLDAKGEVVEGLSLKGYKAVAVPGTVLGLDTLLARYGTMPRNAVMAPAIRLAAEGFVLDQGDADILARSREALAEDDTAAAIFLRKGEPLGAGDRLVQKDLAASLAAIALAGPDAFYRGPIAARIVAESTAHGGILSQEDFASYTVTEETPIRCSYRDHVIISAPPPSSGGTAICQIMNVLEGYPMAEFGWQSAKSVHVMAEAMRHAFVDRNFRLGDPAFVTNPLGELLSEDYAAKIRAAIDLGKAARSADIQPGTPPHGGTETTHFSVVDAKGNAVAVTYTVNALFGAKVIAGDTGFFLNDEMDDFTIKPGTPNLFGLVQGKPNAIAPGKRPLSSMSPTIVLRGGKPFMVLGSPGGSRIISIVVQVLLNVIDHGMTIQEAVNAPRIHHQWLPDQITTEPFALSPDTRALLEAMGHRIAVQTEWGAAEAILIGPEKDAAAAPADSGNDAMAQRATVPGLRYGGRDDRRPSGGVAGY